MHRLEITKQNGIYVKQDIEKVADVPNLIWNYDASDTFKTS